MSNKDSVARTFLVAGLLCVVCSIVVSAAAVGLRDKQQLNQTLDRKKNILQAAGLYEAGMDIEAAFAKIKTVMVDLAKGQVVADNADGFDLKKASKNPEMTVPVSMQGDTGGVKRRPREMPVYQVVENDQIMKLILPIYGKGLWSTLYGFVAVDADTTTIRGIAFYEHGETPGLGGEVDNPRWRKLWDGKKAYDDNWNPKIKVIKGIVNQSNPEAIHQVDGLSGATITARGVSGFIGYWMSEDGYGKYLQEFRSQNGEG